MKPIMILSLILVTLSFPDQIVVQPPSDDSYVLLQSPSTNFGGYHLMENCLSCYFNPDSGYFYTNAQSMVKFLLPDLPYGSVIVSAFVKLWTFQVWEYPGPGNYHLTCCQLNSNWSESTVTWINQPGRSGNYGSIPLTGMGSPIEYDITSLVTEWYQNPSSNYGVGFQLDSDKGPSKLDNYCYQCFTYSKEDDVSISPMLIIDTVLDFTSTESTTLGRIKSYWIAK
jgi:hypothetical protein